MKIPIFQTAVLYAEQIRTRLYKLTPFLLLAGLAGCGYGSSPSVIMETKEFKLGDNAKLIVTRHLDDWRTGNPFTFEWYVVKCQIGTTPPVSMMEDFTLRGTFSSDIPEKRIQIAHNEIGFAYFSEIVVFDKKCNKISHFDPWRTSISVMESGKRTNPMRIETAYVGQNGQGYAVLSWANKSGGTGELKLKTDDYGISWILPTDSAASENGVRFILPSKASFSNSEAIVKQLETSEYVISNGSLVQRPQATFIPSSSLAHEMEFKVLKNALEIAKTRITIGNWSGVVITEDKKDYAVTIGNSSEHYSYYPYSAKVLVSKQSPILAKWLSFSQKSRQ
jgi:hypothetical protein